MKLQDLINFISNELSNISDEPYSEAKIIIQNVLNVSSKDIIFNKEINFNKIQKIINRIIKERTKRIPLQYIFNNVNFYKYNFYVNENVFIPRPETEILVEKIIEIYNLNCKDKKVYIAELGTGSGCISISLSKELEKSIIYSVDISSKALKVAKINMKLLKADKNRLFLLQGDKLNPLLDLKIKFDFILSNPPYISLDNYKNLDAELYNEPSIALTDNNNGLSFYKYLIDVSNNLLKNNGILACEFGLNQKDKIINILSSKDYFKDINIIKDYNKIDRIFIAVKK